LGNAFDLIGDRVDVGPEPIIGHKTTIYFAIKVVFVSLSACLLGATVMVTWRLVRLYGPRRFLNEDSLNIAPNIKPWHLVVFLSLIAAPVVPSAIYKSIESSTLSETPLSDVMIALVSGLIATLLGVVLSLVILRFTSLIQRTLTRSSYAVRPEDTVRDMSEIVGSSPDFFFPTTTRPATCPDRARDYNPPEGLAQRATDFINWLLPPDAKPGYIEAKNGETLILPGHIGAGILLVITFVLYLAIGLFMYLFAYRTGTVPFRVPFSLVPTLCYLLLLAMLLCWGLASLAFFFDRYRIPVLIPLLGLLLITSFFGSDYYYPTPTTTRTTGPNTGENGSDGKQESSSDTMIVVAANGGGIQASAWTARVLTGLEEDCQADPACDQDFGKSIRLISSVSGGSVGTMYFLNEYEKDGTLPEQGLEEIVTRAEGSSLDSIAWGLLYPDLTRTANILPWAFGLFKLDRGLTLDKAWLRKDLTWPKREGIKQGLSQWQEDAEAGGRPGVIFNTTIAETGQRLPLATVALPDKSPGGIRYKQLFEGIEPKPTIRVVTAARLSAAFPYVSPAARAEKTSGTQPPTDRHYENHIVDGGYYDNYGTSSLVEWLDWKLAHNDNHKIKRVLVIQIIASPKDEQVPKSERDSVLERVSQWLSERQNRILYQVTAPAETVLHVRSAGQSTHSAVELGLLSKRWAKSSPCVAITRIPFRFKGEEPPLSWHLTKEDKHRIQTSWQDKDVERKAVTTYLTEQAKGCG